MATSRQQHHVAVDLTTSSDPREGVPGDRAYLVILRNAHDLPGSVIEFLGLDANNPKAAPWDFTEAVLYLISMVLLAATMAILVTLVSTATGGVLAGVVTLTAGVLIGGFNRRHGRR